VNITFTITFTTTAAASITNTVETNFFIEPDSFSTEPHKIINYWLSEGPSRSSIDVKYGRNLQEHVLYRKVTKEYSHTSHEQGRKIILLLPPAQER